MQKLNLTQLLQQAPRDKSVLRAAVHVQLSSVTKEITQGGKPYLSVEIADSGQKQKVKFWNDSQAFRVISAEADMMREAAMELDASFSVSQYGLDANTPSLRTLDAAEEAALFAGDAEFQKLNDANWNFVVSVVQAMKVEPIELVASALLAAHGEEFRRAAAAFGNHHARRGGLLEHTSQMLRCAQALAPLYAEVTPDLLYAGILFHDLGKIVESDYPERGFAAEHVLAGELMGHIAIGAQMIRNFWREIHGEGEKALLMHLTHLILSHHGQLEWGSPVEPKTPEAVLLHQIDMIDSRIEMMRGAYATGADMGNGLVEARRPMRRYVALPWGGVPTLGEDGKVTQ